jgi:NitT/TauT family transport system substrate-binding protein
MVRAAPRVRQWRRLALPVALVLAVSLVAACGGDDDDSASSDEAGSSGSSGSGSSGETITIGFSAWPGWFPWAVAEDQGIFDDVGVNVELKYFSDYTASLDAMAAGQVDANSQTLNDTLVGISGGSDQVAVVVNDNSAGNDAIIADESIRTVQDLEGKSVAAEAGVVDHFLLLQGLADEDMSESDIDFHGLPTDQAAASFAGGEFDAVGVFAPFTTQALEREGSHVLFDSSDYPGTIPDFLVVDRQIVEDRPDDVQKLVEAWYTTLDWIDAHPDEAVEIMADRAEVSAEEYQDFADGTRIFSADEALASMTEDGDTDLGPITEQVSDFLVDNELMEEAPDVEGLYDPSFTETYIEQQSG